MFFLRPAFDPAYVQPRFQDLLQSSLGERAHVHVSSARVVRCKPGRRCLIKYELTIERPGGKPEEIELLGKVRVPKVDKLSYRVQRELWESSFASNAEDGISVPEPLGIIPELQMWVQRHVAGVHPVPLPVSSAGEDLIIRIAEVAQKLYRTAPIPTRQHGISDELRILQHRLGMVAAARPKLAERLERVFRGCERLCASVASPRTCGIHRDFYPDQILVDGDRLYLLDFDLFCAGDPGLDIGNFIGHLIEDSLRRYGNPNALATQQQVMEECFARLYGKSVLSAIHVYTTLTLARHIHISTQFSSRKPFTDALLELSEERLFASAAVL